MEPLLSIVVPVYNEADNIKGVLSEIHEKVNTSHEILVVYDFDEDTTVPVAQSLQSTYPALRLVKNNRGRGALNAMITGFVESTGKACCVTMADLSDDLSSVDAMARMILDEGYDLVAGSRYMKGGSQEGGPWLKSMLSRIAGLTLHWFAGIPVHDATNNFRLYSRRLLEGVTIESTGGFEMALELTVKAHLEGFRLTEAPTTWRDRVAGESRFQLFKWLPKYLRWYLYAFFGRFTRKKQAHPA